MTWMDQVSYPLLISYSQAKLLEGQAVLLRLGVPPQEVFMYTHTHTHTHTVWCVCVRVSRVQGMRRRTLTYDTGTSRRRYRQALSHANT